MLWRPGSFQQITCIRKLTFFAPFLQAAAHDWLAVSATHAFIMLHQKLSALQPNLPLLPDACRKYMEEFAKAESSQIELFLNQVPLLAKLSRADKQRLVDAFVEESFHAGATIIREGDPGDKFYIIKR
jgi:hypothetical protein